MSITTLTVAVNEKTAFIVYHHKDKTEWKPSDSDKICSIRFVGSAYEVNSALTLNLGYEVKNEKARRALIM